MRFIHSSDLHIGKSFGFFEPEVESVLRDARQGIIRTLGELAATHRAGAVVIAGDIYDREQLSPLTVRKPIEAMRQFPRIAWHIIPGNHDHFRENGLWDRLRRGGLPENVKLHTEQGAVEIADDDGTPVYLLPAPLSHRGSADDLSAYMDKAATPAGAVRIGVAHGSVLESFGDEGESANYVAPNRPERAGLAYLAMGDWHRQMRIGERMWYSGTPEPDQFKRPETATGTLCNGGAALLVDVAGPMAAPVVTTIETGRYRWHAVARTLTEDAGIDGLEADLRALDSDLGSVVLDLRLSGTLSLAARKDLEDRIANRLGAAFCGLRLDQVGLVLAPTEADMDDIDRAGFVRVAADRLRVLAEDRSDPERARTAAQALRRLYLEHLRQAAQP